jgi:hypothetical protein
MKGDRGCQKQCCDHEPTDHVASNTADSVTIVLVVGPASRQATLLSITACVDGHAPAAEFGDIAADRRLADPYRIRGDLDGGSSTLPFCSLKEPRQASLSTLLRFGKELI